MGLTPREIDDSASILRRVPCRHVHPDDSNGRGWRLSSKSFSTHNLSGDVEGCRSLAETLADGKSDCAEPLGVVRISVASAKRNNQDVVHVPLELNHAHAEIQGNKSRAKTRLAKDAEMVVLPPGWPECYPDRNVSNPC